MTTLKRRTFIQYLSVMGAALPLNSWAKRFKPVADKAFNFMFLGDLHFDKLMHHDMDYLKEKYPNDIRQIENYSRITRDNLSSLMQVSKECANETDAKFYLQIGDFVEGLCGSKERAAIQTTELINYVEQQKFDRPFIAIKGNHDITGTGAKEVYEEIVLPWQSKQLRQPVTSANNVYVHNKARFILFDCFNEKDGLVWLREVIKDHKPDEQLFFCTHIPVVPYDARANWAIYIKPQQQQDREELLNMLAEHKAIVLSGHLHKTSIVVRNTSKGNFVQVAIGSVIPSLNAPIKNHLKGLDAYTTDLTDLEPNFTPASLQLRKDILAKEKSFIRHYEYADFCGYAAISLDQQNEVNLSIFANADKQPWIKVDLTKLFTA
ncbi:metallophosphoesterase [Mucilaginibacter sp.]|uniref:metallophosphoesterase family protein n=1 Tax=Mucilaginibacter sp. TaxID=1882438 RepID=UPI00261310A2|nr:metallophosphoesterase [Mucilaginibacter sp.]MDB4924230.1 metallophosphoesterase [Mucilaginibacter sp.]